MPSGNTLRRSWSKISEAFKVISLHFFGEKVTCIVYVDDLIFWDINSYDIHNLVMHLQELGVDLEQEGDAAGFLIVTLGQ